METKENKRNTRERHGICKPNAQRIQSSRHLGLVNYSERISTGPLASDYPFFGPSRHVRSGILLHVVVVLVVVVDSHIQRIVPATEETTVTQQISHACMYVWSSHIAEYGSTG